MARSRLPRTFGAVLAAGALTLAACGSDDETTTVDPSTTLDPTTTVFDGDPPDRVDSTDGDDGIPVADSPDGDPDPAAPVGEPATADRSSPEFPLGGMPALLQDLGIDQYDAVDRITLSFTDDSADEVSWSVEEVAEPILESPSGREVNVLGEVHHLLTVAPASGVDLTGEVADQTYTGPQRIRAPRDGGISEVVLVSDFENVMQFAIGTATDLPVGVAVLSGDGEGTRLVVDVLRTTSTSDEVTIASYDEGRRDFSVVTYGSEGGRCFELRLPTDEAPGRDAVECDPADGELEVRVLRGGGIDVLVGVVPVGSSVVDVELVANDGSVIAGDAGDVDIVDLGGGLSAFVPFDDPAFYGAIVGLDDAGDEVVRVEL